MLDNVIRYQHVLTTITYLRIMEITTAFSKYLQTSGLDFIDAFNVVEATKKDIQQIHRDFAMVVTKTDHFVQHANEILKKRGCDVLIESSFPAKRVRKRKNKPLDAVIPNPRAADRSVGYLLPGLTGNDNYTLLLLQSFCNFEG